jgi:hypothetical protein
MKRCRDKTELGFERYLALGVFGRNLHTGSLQNAGKLLIAREHESSNAAYSQRQAA